MKKRDSKPDTGVLEREIDRIVYEVYALSEEEEIGIVEGKANR